MAKEKLVLEANNSKTDYGIKPLFVNAECHSKVKEIANATHLTMRDLSEMLLEYALDNIEIKPSKDGKNPN